jgi:quinoprotein glucose dehydrogenase
MKTQHNLFSLLIFLVVLVACGGENKDVSGQASTTGEPGASAKPGTAAKPSTTGKKSRLNDFDNWATYRGDKEATAYSSLSQITPENVQLLEEVWTYDTKNLVRPGMSSNPIIVEGVMYFADSELNLVALDAATGKELWLFDPSEHHPRGDELSSGIQRGEVYWEDENGENARIFHSTIDLIWAVNPEDGTLIESFGKGGFIDLKEDNIWPAHLMENKMRNNSPPVTYKNHLILDSNVHENREEPPGNIRSFNTITGEYEWTFHTVPLEGQPGYETWEWEDNMIYGGANSWGGFTVDEKRGWVFAATGAPTGGIHGNGGARPGKNLFANSVLAIDAETGELQWYFQTMHHDIWDYDIAPAPMLATITEDGVERDVVVQTGKQGKFFVFDRDTGESLFPIVEKPVPTDAAPGEVPYPTQPWPLKPDPLVRTSFYESDLTTITPESHASALEKFKKLKAGPMYTPPSIEGTIVQPGIHGGNEWGGPAFDPETNIAYVNVNDFPFILTLDPMQPDQFADMSDLQRGKTIYSAQCAACHGAERQGGIGLPLDKLAFSDDDLKEIITQGRNAMPAFPYFEDEELDYVVAFLQAEPGETGALPDVNLSDESLTWSGGEGELTWSTSTPQYVAQLDYFTDHMGYHAIKPPWGKLIAVDVAKGEIKWSVPLGEYPGLVEMGIRHTGAENFGGMAVTKGGLIFIAATEDSQFRAFNKTSGELLWEFKMDAPGFSSPSVYEVDGRQYVVIVAGGGGGRYRSPVTGPIGKTVHAFALPPSEAQ